MIIENGIWFAFLATVSWGIGDFLIQRSVKKIGVTESLGIIGIIGSVGLLPFIWNEIPLLFLPENGILLLILGIITFAAAILNFEAYKIGKLSVVEVILELELPVTILLALLLFNETLSVTQIIIIFIGFLGIVLMATKTFDIFHSHKHWFEKGTILAAAAAIGIGIIDFLTAAAARNISPLMAIWAPWVIITLASLMIVWKKNRLPALWKHIKQNKKLVLATGIVDTIAWASFAIALSVRELAITTAITESYPAIAMGLAIAFNHEKIKKHQWIGALLAVGGSIALAFFI